MANLNFHLEITPLSFMSFLIKIAVDNLVRIMCAFVWQTVYNMLFIWCLLLTWKCLVRWLQSVFFTKSPMKNF